ncbi:hypothetical protein BDM02DRAFT_2351782 [Thelephora ganbajun]|uniref:Uncharacterized protein n=1 Tax=Thelephora ganbajun TaxID=370292 RepID=A0ACB6ZEX9_THEGA|nr:hypothetical protein BDM02DRAFT_2351782 [Thelephora ganbajun]
MSLFRPPTNPILYAVFPQELIDKVIDSLDPTDSRTFRACSLVAKSWTYPSWAMVFCSVSITSWEIFQRWCLNTIPGPGGPGSFVRSLTFDEMHSKWITPDILLMGERHLKSFKNLVSFIAIGLQINYFFDDPLLSQCFGLFCRGVREVRLVHPHGSPRIMASFIQQFPIIRRLSIEFYSETWSPAPEREEYTSIGFTGSLQLVSDASTDRRDRQLFIFYLIIFPVLYKEISVVASLKHSWQYQSLFRACSKTLKRLRIVDVRSDPARERSWEWAQDIPKHQGLSIEPCLNLREVFLGVTRSPGPMLENLLNSITSPKLVTITFELVWDEYPGGNISSIVDIEAWRCIDEALCALVDRLPNRNGSEPLSVVLSVRAKVGTNLDSTKMGAFLEKFKEKGRVTMTPFKGFLQPVCHYPPSENVLSDWMALSGKILRHPPVPCHFQVALNERLDVAHLYAIRSCRDDVHLLGLLFCVRRPLVTQGPR